MKPLPECYLALASAACVQQQTCLHGRGLWMVPASAAHKHGEAVVSAGCGVAVCMLASGP